MSKTRLIRLTSGEEILCNKTNESGLTITVAEIIALVPTKERLGFMPYMPYCEIDQLVIKKEHIMFDLTPTKELAAEHVRMHSSEIIGADKPQIVV
jgi:hypothetical protein|tara:strand:- start:196 stop:483 length:288 start_codon:yes stop_codon:yes gene_type:complete